MNYEQAVKHTWHHSENESMTPEELVRYATLAPSSHNTQCWKFRIDNGYISIIPDFSRCTPVVDPENHHLYISLGCAAENLSLAARASGSSGDARFREEGDGEIMISLEAADRDVSPLFDAIVSRQCTRSEYDAAPLAEEELALLRDAGTGEGVSLILVNERDRMEILLEAVVKANAVQVSDRAFRRELESWVRFSDRETIRTGDGLSARVTGNPPIPRWIGKFILRATLGSGSAEEKLKREIRSAAGLAIFTSEHQDRKHWVEVGRCYQRFALQATLLGVRNAFINQVVEVPSVRKDLSGMMSLDGRQADLCVRFGRGKEVARSLRRPLQSVLTKGSVPC